MAGEESGRVMLRAVCRVEAPAYRDVGGRHQVRCHFADELSLRGVKVS